MQPNQQQDNVWISREEYDRLRQQAQQPTPQYSPQPAMHTGGYQVTDEPAKISQTQAIVGALLAFGLFLSLTVPLFKFVIIPILVILLIFATMSLNDFKKAKQRGTVVPGVAGGESIQKKVNRKYHTLLLILMVTLAAPVMFIGGIIILVIIFLASGGANNASS